MSHSISSGEKLVVAAIENATEITSPLAALMDRAIKSPNTIYDEDAIQAIRELRRSDFPEYTKCIKILKSFSFDVARVVELVEAENGIGVSNRQKQIDLIIAIVDENELFLSPDGTAYAEVRLKECKEVFCVSEVKFADWIRYEYDRRYKQTLSIDAIKTAISAIQSKCRFEGKVYDVYHRVAKLGNYIYFALGDADRHIVEISQSGWRVIKEAPVKFYYSNGSKPLPVPKKGGNIKALRKFINVASDQDFALVVAWMLAALSGLGPYPILVVTGEQGTAKSTTMKMLKLIIDPHAADLRPPPIDEKTLYIAAKGNHLLAYDNFSQIPNWLSDAFCRIVTGAGYASRQLYTDADEITIDVCRPVILNGIDDFVTRGDLADRSIFIELERISPENRLPEREVIADFNAVLPEVLGALLDEIVKGLEVHESIRLNELPRMADFAKWAVSCESSKWCPPEGILSIYVGNRNQVVGGALDADLIGSGILKMLKERDYWCGTATELLMLLHKNATPAEITSRAWPSNAKAVSDRLKRLAPALRAYGVSVERGRSGRGGTRQITISKNYSSSSFGFGKGNDFASAASADEEDDLY